MPSRVNVAAAPDIEAPLCMQYLHETLRTSVAYKEFQ